MYVHYCISVMRINTAKYIKMSWKVQYFVNSMYICGPYFGHLTFNQCGWYLNFSTWFMKNALFEQKKIKLWKKQHFVKK
jgi:hypothetical protein